MYASSSKHYAHFIASVMFFSFFLFQRYHKVTSRINLKQYASINLIAYI